MLPNPMFPYHQTKMLFSRYSSQVVGEIISYIEIWSLSETFRNKTHLLSRFSQNVSKIDIKKFMLLLNFLFFLDTQNKKPFSFCLCQNIQGLINKPRELSTLSRNKCCIPAFGCRNAERYNHSHSKHFGRVSRKKTLKSKYPPLYQWKPDSKILTAIINLTQAKIIAVFCISFLQQDRNVRKHWKVFSIFYLRKTITAFYLKKKYFDQPSKSFSKIKNF